MDSHFTRQLDPRLEVSSDLAYNVVSGASSITSQRTPASSVDTTQAIFNVQVPSQRTLVDTHVLYSKKIVLKVSGLVTAGNYIINYGTTDALCPFPGNSLFNVVSTTINNAVTTTNVKDILPALLHCYDKEDLNLFQSLTPTALDTCYEYPTQVASQSNVLAGYEKSDLNRAFVPRGTFKIDSISSVPPPQAVAPLVIVGAGAPAVRDAYITITIQEPLMLSSPWSFTNKADRPCLTGVINMAFNFTFNDGAKLWRWADDATIATNKTCSVFSVSDAYLQFQMLTPHSSMAMPARSVLPYYQIPKYSQTIGAGVGAGLSVDLPSTTYTLNSIPDTLIIYARDPARTSGQYADAFMKINSINLNWNNNSGLMNGYTSAQLFQLSSRNGSSQNFYEWHGKAHFGGVAGVGGGGVDVTTIGGILVLKFGKDIQLQDTEAPGSLGNYQLQFTLNVTNQTAANIANLELFTVCVQSGLMVTEAGVTSNSIGLLTASDVIKVSDQPASFDYGPRMLGSGVFDKLNSVIKPHIQQGAKFLADHPQIVQAGLKKLAGGKQRFH